MEYRRFADTYVVRMDKGEEIAAQLTKLAEEEHIALAEVSALGAVGDITVGVFYPEEKEYHANTFQGKYEIVSLTGTITEQDGKPYLHLHLSAGDQDGRVVGGHLNRAVISATCEVVVRVLPGRVGRKFSPEIGLNLLDFSET